MALVLMTMAGVARILQTDCNQNKYAAPPSRGFFIPFTVKQKKGGDHDIPVCSCAIACIDCYVKKKRKNHRGGS